MGSWHYVPRPWLPERSRKPPLDRNGMGAVFGPGCLSQAGNTVFKEAKGRGDPDCAEQELLLTQRTSYLFGMCRIFLPPYHRGPPVLVLAVKRRFPGDGNVPFQSLLSRYFPTSSWEAQQDRKPTLNFSLFLGCFASREEIHISP